MKIAWQGPPPDRPLRRVLEAADIGLARSLPDADAIVVASAEARRVPRAPAGGLPWLWVTAGRIGDAAAVRTPASLSAAPLP